MQVILAQPRGFCAGVVRAIDIVERALERRGAPVYVRHEIVHNKAVVDGLRAKGAVFVEALESVPPGAVESEGRERALQVFDAEVEGTMGQIHGRVLLAQDERDVDALDLPADAPLA